MLSLTVGFVVLMVVGRKLWFTADEWDFIVYRGFHHPAIGWMTPHNEHWSALPIVIWRALFTFVGLHHYWPYLAFVLLAHVIALHLMWRLAEKFDIDPWLSTAIVAAAVALGIGYENLTYAFQIGFVGSIAFGMGAVLLSLELPAEWRPVRRLYGVWALSILGLACSGIGVTMVVATTAVTFLVKGLRPAILVTVVPAVVYAGWYEVWGKTAVNTNALGINDTNYHQLPNYVANGLSSALGGWLDYDGAGPIILVLLVAAVATRRPRGVGAIPLAFLVTTGFFFIVTATGRVGAGVPEAAASRYSYISVFLLLPLVLLALNFLVERGGYVIPVGLAVALAVSGVVRINTHATHDAVNERIDRNSFVADATVLRLREPALVTQPIVDDPGLTPAAMAQLDRGGQLSSFPRPSASEIAQAHYDLQVATGPTQVEGDAPPSLVSAPPGVTPTEKAGCLSVPVSAGGANVVTFKVGAVTSSISFVLTAPVAVGVSLTSAGSSTVAGPNSVTLAAGVTWLRVAAPGSVATLSFPAGTFLLCHLGLQAG